MLAVVHKFGKISNKFGWAWSSATTFRDTKLISKLLHDSWKFMLALTLRVLATISSLTLDITARFRLVVEAWSAAGSSETVLGAAAEMLSTKADDEAKIENISSETEWALNQSEPKSVGKGYVCALLHCTLNKTTMPLTKPLTTRLTIHTWYTGTWSLYW